MGIVDKAVINLINYSKQINIYFFGLLLLLFLPVIAYLKFFKNRGKNPFTKTHLRKRGDVELDPAKRDAVLKQVILFPTHIIEDISSML